MKNIYLVTLLLTGLFWRVCAQTPLPCGVNDRQLPDSTILLMGKLPQLMVAQKARRAAGVRNVCRVAVEIDSDTYLEFDKDTNRIRSFFLDKIEQTSKIYEREINTQLVVVYFHIWKDTEADPYRGEQDAFNLFGTFSRQWANQFNQIPYDKRIYLLTKPTTAAGGIGGGIQAISANYADLFTIAHEFGHCFNSPHTHNCAWPGGPIDYCSSVEGGCYSGALQNLYDGTLMSYCSRSPTFHPLCRAVMTDFAMKNLAVLAAPSQAPVLPVQLTLSGTPFMYWNGQGMAERYDVEVATDAVFSQRLVSDTASVNGIYLRGLTIGQTYYARVRAVNRYGVSDWSGVCRLQRVSASGLAAPVLTLPANGQRFIPYNQGICQFAFQPVPGVSRHEIQVTNFLDDLFKSPATTFITSGTFTSVALYRVGLLRWRARAVSGNTTGPWSESSWFSVNPGTTSSSNITLPFESYEAAPLTFPVSYNPTTSRATVRMMLATDTSFTQPIYVRMVATRSFNNTVQGMAEKLLPNTQYYFKVEESNTQLPFYPTGLLTTTTQAIRTGSNSLPERWALLNEATNPDYPPGFTFGPLAMANNAVWLNNGNGITRIGSDSLSVRLYTPQTTNGAIGNVTAALTVDRQGNPWVTNQLSGTAGISVINPIIQVGKIDEQTGMVNNASTFIFSSSLLTFSISPRLFCYYDGIYEQGAGGLSKIYSQPAQHSIIRVLLGAGTIWMIQYNSGNSSIPYELVQFNTITRTTRVFSAENTPQLQAQMNALAIDALGNLWVQQSSSIYPYISSLVKFDGQTWVKANSPFLTVSYLTSDPLGNLYVLDNTFSRSLFRYDGIKWKNLTTLALYANLGDITADAQGNVWFNGPFQLIRYAACANAPTPTLKTASQTIEAGNSATLQAVGCTDVLWSWSSEAETVTNRLIRGTNQLVVKPNVNTTYQSRCYTTNCAGEEATLTLSVKPTLTLTRSPKIVYCAGDSLTVGYSLLGKTSAANQYAFVYNAAGQTSRLPATARGATLSTVLPATMQPGPYVFYVETGQPVIRAQDSLQLAISIRPTAELSTDKLTFSLGDSARISVALTGQSPWQFIRWDKQLIRTSTSPYLTTFRATQPTNYTLSITSLSDANCTGTVIKNGIVVSALALGSEPTLTDDVRVYPNPTTDQLIVEPKTGIPPLTIVQLRDEQGREIRRKAGPTRREEWDLRGLPTGQYILHLEIQDGRSANWKIVKQ